MAFQSGRKQHVLWQQMEQTAVSVHACLNSTIPKQARRNRNKQECLLSWNTHIEKRGVLIYITLADANMLIKFWACKWGSANKLLRGYQHRPNHKAESSKNGSCGRLFSRRVDEEMSIKSYTKVYFIHIELQSWPFLWIVGKISRSLYPIDCYNKGH